MTQPMPGKPAEDAENELDIRGLFRTLWAGKLWIIGMGLAFALIALAYTFFARQEWSSTAITDRPTVNMLGGYYSQQQFLRNLDVRSNMASADQPSVMDEAYKRVCYATGLVGYPQRVLAANRLLQAADGGQQQSRCGVAG